MTDKKLYRSRTNRMIAGVAGGLGEYLEVDPVVVRIVFVLLALLGHGAFILLYIIGAIIIPEAPLAEGETDATAHEHTEEASSRSRKNNNRPLFGWILIFLGLFFLANSFLMPLIALVAFWPVLLIILGLLVIFGGLKKKG